MFEQPGAGQTANDLLSVPVVVAGFSSAVLDLSECTVSKTNYIIRSYAIQSMTSIFVKEPRLRQTKPLSLDLCLEKPRHLSAWSSRKDPGVTIKPAYKSLLDFSFD